MTKQDAIVETLKIQRNQALDTVAYLNGQIVELTAELEQLRNPPKE